ncbi:MAG TPA: DUF1343 domain-containing protein, partial [Bacteroidota bacterium]|nr:DUF1343 domain-containing protein [Bacteroidota bacterium]
MKPHAALALICFLAAGAPAQEPAVKTGIEVLREEHFSLLKGKRIGLITNPTGVDSRLRSTVDILTRAPGVRVVALFGPEHGVRGDHAAGDEVETSVDSETGLPAYSLYGKTRKATPGMLRGIDMLIYDIQDIGCRSYTYISTMGLAMEAAAEQHIPFVVLDRPDPLGGLRVEGNVVAPGFESFVGQYPVPYVYGLTCGELARYLNGEGLLKGGVRCSLTVVAMKGWRREMQFGATGLPWVPASPHVPEPESPEYYVGTGMLGELGVISEGVGYTLPFQMLGAEWIDAAAVADSMNRLGIPGVLFRPVTFRPFYGTWKEKEIHGTQVYIAPGSTASLMSIQFYFMQVASELWPERNPFLLAAPGRRAAFDRVAGSDSVRILFTQRMRYDDVRPYLEKDVQAFREKAKKYL